MSVEKLIQLARMAEAGQVLGKVVLTVGSVVLLLSRRET